MFFISVQKVSQVEMSPPKKKPSGRPAKSKQTGNKKRSDKDPVRSRKKNEESENELPKIRIQKFLASAGVGSRRHCEEYVESGRITVDGKVVSDLGFTVNPEKQKIRLDGELVRTQPKRYYLLHKPAGFLCTNSDPSGRPRAVDLIRQEKCRLFTVGRLDENSTGLIIVTNDGDLAHRLAHPSFQIPRQYRVQVVGKPTKETLNQLQKGLYFSDGHFRVRGVKKVKTQGKSTFLELRLTEGQNREIRRLMARVGHKVISLQRIGFASIKLGRLPLGKSRMLKPVELKSLLAYIEKTDQIVKSKKKTTQSKKTTRKKTGVKTIKTSQAGKPKTGRSAMKKSNRTSNTSGNKKNKISGSRTTKKTSSSRTKKTTKKKISKNKNNKR